MGSLSFAIEHLQPIAQSTPELGIVVLALRDALEGAERVRRTVRDLKTFSRPASESKGPVDLDKVLNAAVSMARGDLQHRARLVIDAGVVPLVKGSEPHLAQVFLALLLHAALGIEEGHVDAGEVRVTARQTSPGEVTVDIVSTGGGSRESGAAGILDLGSAEADDERTGFGLTFCRRVVEEYGGAISVDAEAGTSSSIHVRLMVSTDAPALAETPSREKGGARRARVLVVDDEPRIGSAIARILSPVHEVTAVHTATEAIDRLESGEDYDVILCDLMMPQMSGADLYRSLEARVPRFTSRMVFMTGGPFSMRGASLLETVPNRRLEKPFSPETLRAVVEKFVTAD
jgi:CheY-like chemotaxis protein